MNYNVVTVLQLKAIKTIRSSGGIDKVDPNCTKKPPSLVKENVRKHLLETEGVYTIIKSIYFTAHTTATNASRRTHIGVLADKELDAADDFERFRCPHFSKKFTL